MRLIGWECKYSNVFSRPILIGRGFNLCTLLKTKVFTILGHNSGRGTPDPISNSEVKPSNAYGTYRFTIGRVGSGQEL